MRLADFGDDRLGGRARIRRLRDRATHDQVVGAIANGLGGRGDALLVADRAACGPNAGGDKEELRADGLARQAASSALATSPSTPSSSACSARRRTVSTTPKR